MFFCHQTHKKKETLKGFDFLCSRKDKLTVHSDGITSPPAACTRLITPPALPGIASRRSEP